MVERVQFLIENAAMLAALGQTADGQLADPTHAQRRA